MDDAVPRTGMIFDLKSGRIDAVYALVVAMTSGAVMEPRGVRTLQGPEADRESSRAGV